MKQFFAVDIRDTCSTEFFHLKLSNKSHCIRFVELLVGDTRNSGKHRAVKCREIIDKIDNSVVEICICRFIAIDIQLHSRK